MKEIGMKMKEIEVKHPDHGVATNNIEYFLSDFRVKMKETDLKTKDTALPDPCIEIKTFVNGVKLSMIQRLFINKFNN
jgi:hypothetical protein